MTSIDDKENLAPLTSSDPLARKDGILSPKKNGRRGRSKSIGPGLLDEPEPPKQSAKDRRKSAFVPATTKSILSKNEESERAARRKSMMNRRVSFAPEATLHTWEDIVDAKDHTTSTDSADSTRRASNFSRSSSSPGPGSDASQEDAEMLSPPAFLPGVKEEGQGKSKRRSSGIPPMNFNNPEDAYSSGLSGSEEESASEDEEAESSDDTGTAMSLDVDDATMQSAAGSENSTSSSERLERSLRQAALAAGTRGIEYDEFGDMSMEIAGDEITNAFKPWAQGQPDDAVEAVSLDQENINPFSPVFKAETMGNPDTVDEGDEEDMSMDVTHAVGGILQKQSVGLASSPMSDSTMELTQAIGKITGQKRRRSANETGSPGASVQGKNLKRRRSSAARSSMGDDTMDLTTVVGGIQSTGSPVKSERRRSLRNRRSSEAASEADDATMELTRAVGGIHNSRPNNNDNFVGDEELSMELTTALGGIGNRHQPPSKENSRPVTPRNSESPVRSAANVTPKDLERFKDTLDMSAKKLLAPILQEQIELPAEGKPSPKGNGRVSSSPLKSPTGISSSVRSKQNTPAEARGSTEPAQAVSPVQEVASYPELRECSQKTTPITTPVASSPRRRDQRTPTDDQRGDFTVQLQGPDESPTAAKQLRSSPTRAEAVTPQKLGLVEDSRDFTNSMKLLTTPRKEPLRNVTPKKQQSAKQASPLQVVTPRGRLTSKGKEPRRLPASPIRHLQEDLEKIQESGQQVENIGLQDFLSKAGVRFMDLTTTKRRLTTAPTPSKPSGSSQDEEEITLENGVVAAACIVPELELYQHACHELKRYTKEGKQMISDLETTTLKDQPPLIRAYMHAVPARKLSLDAQMRDMKTDARLRSKEMWYAWRSQLLDELMVGLQKIGEGMIKDDEVLNRSEDVIEQVLPSLVKEHGSLQQHANQLEERVNAIAEDEKAELKVTRDRLNELNDEITGKRRELEALRQQVQEQDSAAEHLRESKEEFIASTQEANRVRESCRGVSLNEITALKDSVQHLEDTFGWTITSASSSPLTVTMAYKSELQLFFHPEAFRQTTSGKGRSNSAIGLTYIAESKKPLTTILRFFLQLLRASLQGLEQCTTKISDLLAFVSNGWDTVCAIMESERKLNLKALTESRIVSDEQLAISSNVLLIKVKTKVRATFHLTASVDEDLQLNCSVVPDVSVIYGEQYNEKNMTEFLKGLVDGYEGWDTAVGQMREKLIARGPKGARK